MVDGLNIIKYKLCGFNHWSSSWQRLWHATRSVFASYCCCGCSGQEKKKRQVLRFCKQYFAEQL